MPGSGAKVCFFQTLSSTPITVYKDNAASVAWSNPIVLDSGGNLPSGATVWVSTGTLARVQWAPSNDTFPPASPYRTIDNLTGIGDTSSPTSSTVTFLQAGSGAVATTVQAKERIRVDLSDFGGLGDDTFDNITAIQNADTLVSGLGGGTINIGPGTFKFSSRYQPSNNITINGAGTGVTFLHNSSVSSPGNLVIDARGTLGANYAINAPTEGGFTVTTTVAANAGNFTAGQNIAISGAVVGVDYGPFFITTVVSAVAGTGVITLSEPLPRSDFTLVQVITTLKQKIVVQNLTVKQGGDVGIIYKYARDCVIRNVEFGPSLGTAALSVIGCRNTLIEDCRGTFNFGTNSSFETKFLHNALSNTPQPAIIFENACEEGVAMDNTIINPTPNGHGMKADTSSQRVKFLFNKVVGVTSTFAGVFIDGNAAGFGENIVIGNHIFGNYGAFAGVTIGGTSHDNVIIGNSFKSSQYGVFLGAGNNLRQIIYGNTFNNMTTASVSITAGSTAIDMQIVNALVATGGSSAAVVGTTGGSGPSTAAQNSWMRVMSMSGASSTPFWVPVWK